MESPPQVHQVRQGRTQGSLSPPSRSASIQHPHPSDAQEFGLSQSRYGEPNHYRTSTANDHRSLYLPGDDQAWIATPPGSARDTLHGRYDNAHRMGGVFMASTTSLRPGPNLDKLTPVYYRLFWEPRTALPSCHPLYEDDPSLSSIYLEHIPPPRLTFNYIAYISARERIHSSRLKLYINTTQRDGSDAITLVQNEDAIRRGANACGTSERNPILITVEMKPSRGGVLDRNMASQPLGVWIEGSRAIGDGVTAAGTSCLGAFGMCFSSFQRWWNNPRPGRR